MAKMPESRVVVLSQSGNVRCIGTRGGILTLPAEFAGSLDTLAGLLHLIGECNEIFGGTPVPVAKSTLKALEMYRTALDLAIKTAEGKR